MKKLLKILPVLIFLIIGVMLFSGRFDFALSYAFYAIGGFVCFILILIVVLGIYAAYASSRAYKVRSGIRMEPAGDGSGGTVIVDIQNSGEGDIVISNVGVYDRRLVEQKRSKGGTSYANEDVALYAKETSGRLPLRVLKGSADSLSIKVDSKQFQSKFSGVFFEIDARQSDIPNKYARQFAEGRLSIGNVPKGIVRKKITDGRLHKRFCKK